jgi:hypothetical protein
MVFLKKAIRELIQATVTMVLNNRAVKEFILGVVRDLI